jgi:hypothetical protein
MALNRARRRGVKAAGVLLSAAFVAVVAALTVSASTTFDIRGDWDELATVGLSQFPQTLHITSEDLATGAFSGTDVGPDGTTFTATGTLTGAGVTFTSTGGKYTSHATGTVTGTGTALQMSGSFTDSNGSNGSWSARLVHATGFGAGAGATPAASVSSTASASSAAAANSGAGATSGAPPGTTTNSSGSGLPTGLLISAAAILAMGTAAAFAISKDWFSWNRFNRQWNPKNKWGGNLPQPGPANAPPPGYELAPTAPSTAPAGYGTAPTPPSTAPPGYELAPSTPTYGIVINPATSSIAPPGYNAAPQYISEGDWGHQLPAEPTAPPGYDGPPPGGD